MLLLAVKVQIQSSLDKHSRLLTGILPTALVSIEDDSSQIIKCRALLDSGSQMSLISEEAVQRMKLKRHKHSLTVNGIETFRGPTIPEGFS